MQLNKYIFFLSCSLIITATIQAQVKLPAVFADGMVLQQKSEVKIWGWADKGSEVIVTPSWNGERYTTKANRSGSWETAIPSPGAGGPYDIKISDGAEIVLNNVLIGEVWLCSGQSNMEMPMKGYTGQPVLGSQEDILRSENDAIRFISVPRSYKTIPQKDFEGEWHVAGPKTVSGFSATAYYFACLVHEILDIPVGLIEVSYGGSCVEAWMSKETSGPFNGVGIPGPGDSTGIDNRTPTSLFNGMLHPVIGYTIKGAIWYQGEQNHINAGEYIQRFPAMVKEWRSLWAQGDFPFYYAQIAPHDYAARHSTENYKEAYNSTYLREAQLKALESIPNSGMAVLMDAGHKTNIHPANKEVVGERLAYWALAKTYGVEGIGYASPTLKEMTVEGSTVVLSFNHVPNGLTSFGKALTLFEIAGEDRRFYPAKAHLRRKSVILSAPQVSKPVAVRYAFDDYVEGELFSTEGLPVSSFRTDDW